MTRDELNSQLLQLVNILRSALSENRQWDDVSDWSRGIALTDRVSVRFSPGDHATALIVTFADKGVRPLAPDDFDKPAREPVEKPPSDHRNNFEKRVQRFVAAVEAFDGWQHNGTLTRSLTLADGTAVARIVRSDGTTLITLSEMPAEKKTGAI